jgi:hypothetical protein
MQIECAIAALKLYHTNEMMSHLIKVVTTGLEFGVDTAQGVVTVYILSFS